MALTTSRASGSPRIQTHTVVRIAKRHPLVLLGGGILLLLILLALAAPLYSGDPLVMDPFKRLQQPSASMWFGTDTWGGMSSPEQSMERAYHSSWDCFQQCAQRFAVF